MQTRVNSGDGWWLHRVGACRKEIGRRPSCREASQRVAADNGCSAEACCSPPQSCFRLRPFHSEIPPLAALRLTPAAVFLFTLPTFLFPRVCPAGQTRGWSLRDRRKLQTVLFWWARGQEEAFNCGGKNAPIVHNARMRHRICRWNICLQGT